MSDRVYTYRTEDMLVGRKFSEPSTEVAGGEVVTQNFPPPIETRRDRDIPRVIWTSEKKAIVYKMAQHGIPHEDIATVTNCTVRELNTYCRDELRHARINANCAVAEVFYRMATSGKVPAATMQWMKSRVAGFKDSVEHSGQVTHVHEGNTIDASKLTIDQLRAIEAAYAAGAKEVVTIEGVAGDE
jgi:hypothetical protein